MAYRVPVGFTGTSPQQISDQIRSQLAQFQAGNAGDLGVTDYGNGMPLALPSTQPLDTSGAGYRDLTAQEQAMYDQAIHANESKGGFGEMVGDWLKGGGGFALGALGPMIAGAAGVGGFSNSTGGLGNLFGGGDAGTAYGGGAEGMQGDYWNQTGGAGGGMDGLDLSRLTDPSYWNELGGNTGLADAGAAGTYLPNVTYGGAGGAVGGGSAVQQLLKAFGGDSSGGSGMDAVLNLLGKSLPGILGAYGSSQQGNQLQAITDRARADRQPSLDYYNNLLKMGPEGFAAGEGSQAIKGLLSGLSVQGGNPFGNPGGLAQGAKALEGLYGNRLTQAAGPAGLVSGTGLMQGDINAAQAGGGLYTGLSSALGGALAPQNDLASLLKSLQGLNLSPTIA